jgi:transposase
VHLAIAAKAAQLRGLELSDRRIAQAIGVSDKTVAKSLQRFRIEESLGTLDEAEGPQGD